MNKPSIVAVYTDSIKQVDHSIGVYLSDGTIYMVPLEKMPMLFLFAENTTAQQRADFCFTDEGKTVRWEGLNYNLTLDFVMEFGKKGEGKWGPERD